MSSLLYSGVAVPFREKATLQHEAHVVTETSVGGLQRHIAAWESLARDVIEPNPFYEHWMLIPALREIPDEDVQVLFIYVKAHGSDLLCGVIPIVRRRVYRNLPIPNYSFWKHKYCFLCTPLLRNGSAEDVLSAYFNWVEQNASSWSLVDFNCTSGEGVFSALLDAELARRQHQ